MPPDEWMSVRPSVDDDAKEPVVENGVVNGTKEEWKFSFDKRHYLFLLGHELLSFGYPGAREVIEMGLLETLHNVDLAEGFKAAVLDGHWPRVFGLLAHVMRDEEAAACVKKSIYRQMVLELLEGGKVEKAVCLLREEISSTLPDHDFIQHLASFLLCMNGEDLRRKSSWPGMAEGRRELLRELRRETNQRVLPREFKIAEILEAHLGADCGLLDGPRTTEITFRVKEQVHRNGEVTCLAVSPDGGMFACGLSNGQCYLTTSDGMSMHLDYCHEDRLTKLAFGEDANDGCLLVTGLDGNASTFQAQYRSLDALIEQPNSVPLLSGAWLLERNLVFCWEDGRLTLETPDKVVTIILRAKNLSDVITWNGHIIASYQNNVICIDVEGRVIWKVPLEERITSLNVAYESNILSADGSKAVYCMSLEDGRVLNRIMTSPVPEKHVIRSCIVDGFLLRGEYGGDAPKINIWNWRKGMWIGSLSGHQGSITCLAWNPARRELLSGSDDRSIIIWTMEK